MPQTSMVTNTPARTIVETHVLQIIRTEIKNYGAVINLIFNQATNEAYGPSVFLCSNLLRIDSLSYCKWSRRHILSLYLSTMQPYLNLYLRNDSLLSSLPAVWDHSAIRTSTSDISQELISISSRQIPKVTIAPSGIADSLFLFFDVPSGLLSSFSSDLRISVFTTEKVVSILTEKIQLELLTSTAGYVILNQNILSQIACLEANGKCNNNVTIVICPLLGECDSDTVNLMWTKPDSLISTFSTLLTPTIICSTPSTMTRNMPISCFADLADASWSHCIHQECFSIFGPLKMLRVFVMHLQELTLNIMAENSRSHRIRCKLMRIIFCDCKLLLLEVVSSASQ